MIWTYTFPGGQGGCQPFGPLFQMADGAFYGTTSSGGASANCGTVFKLDQHRHLSLVYAFKDIPDGSFPLGGLTLGTDGNLYGTTAYGGRNEAGTLFQITPTGKHTILYYFSARATNPYAAPAQSTNGLFYGTTYGGGRSNYGTVYSLNMGLGPFVAFVQPTGGAGATAQILGQSLTGATSVTFNGVPATSFKVASDTFLTAVVPAGATTGPVVVTTPTGPLTSNKNFTILQ